MITVLISCSSSKTNSLSRRQKARAIDSLLLIPSLPITISANDPFFRKDIRALLEDSLKAKKYKCLSGMKARALYNQKLEEFRRSVNNENEMTQPYMQSLTLFPCTNETGNCVGVKRLNYPDAGKQRIWMLKYEDKESISHLVTRIIDSVTSHQNIQ